MKSLLIVLLFSFVSTASAQFFSGSTSLEPVHVKGVSFYCFNEAFRDMPIQVISPTGEVFTEKWVLTGYDRWMDRAEFKFISFPIDGRNCKVRLYLKNYKGDTTIVNFLLNDCDYTMHPIYVLISSVTFAPAMSSNFGPIDPNLRYIAVWNYPQDDFVINPKVKKLTKLAIANYYEQRKKQAQIKRLMSLVR